MLVSAQRVGKWEGTVRQFRKTGQPITASVVITPRRNASGRWIGYVLVSKDVSADIRVNEQLRATQFYTRSLIESNIDALMTTDPLGIITDVNQQMEALTGYTREQLIGSPFRSYFTDSNRAEEGIRQVLRDGRVTNFKLTALSKTGKITLVSYNASTFRDGENKLQGVFAAARDITEQKKLEQQLRDSEAYNRGLIEASVDGLITVDPSGAITDINEQMARISGYALIAKLRAFTGDLGGQTPAIALTAYARSEDRTRAILAGYQMHVSEPVEPAEIIAMVASLAGRTQT